MSDIIKLVMPGGPEYIPTARLTIGSIASVNGYDVEEIEDIKTAVGEACQLIFCHEMEGYSKEYTLECEVDRDKITVNVINTSTEIKEKTDKRCLDCPNEGELGKLMIKSLMDEAEVCCDLDGNKTIIMVKTKK